MNISNEVKALKAWCDNDNLWVQLTDGRQLSVPLAFFPRLLHADVKHRSLITMSGGGSGLHWDELDEDISVPGLLLGYGDATRTLQNAI